MINLFDVDDKLQRRPLAIKQVKEKMHLANFTRYKNQRKF